MPDKNARPATPAEILIWERFKRYYERELVPTIHSSKVVAEIANRAQQMLNKYGMPGVVFSAESLARTQLILNRANIIGRYIQAVESGKYGINLVTGDIEIRAPLGMPAEEYQADLYPTLGIAPIIWVLSVGAILVGGILAVATALKFDAQKEREQNAKKLIDIDKQMSTAPADQRAAWIEFKKQNAAQANETGVFSKIFGGKFMGELGAGVAVGIALLLAIMAWSKKR